MRRLTGEGLASSRRAQVALIGLTGVFAVIAVSYTLPSPNGLRHVLDVGVYDNVVLAAGAACLARAFVDVRDRMAWIAIGTAGLAWGIGDTVWTFTVADMSDPPYPSTADHFYLAVYPAAYVGIVLLLHSRVHELRKSLWLDGVISGLAVAAVGTAIIFPAIKHTVDGGTGAAVATNVAYPLADLTLIGIVVWALAVTGWRPGRTWGLVAAGLLVFSISDCFYLYQTAVGTYVSAAATDLGWVGGCVLLAWAAWQPRTSKPPAIVEGWPLLFAPVTFGLIGLAVLLYDHVERVNPLALVLASLSILGVIAR